MHYAKVRTLYNQVPILSTQKIASILDIPENELKDYCIFTGIASEDDYQYRSRFISYSLEGNHMMRCRYCGILAHNFCDDCIQRFEPTLYDTHISWYRNMMSNNFMPTNEGWQNEVTGIFLPRFYQEFFRMNEVLP